MRKLVAAAFVVSAVLITDVGHGGAAQSSRLALEFLGQQIFPTGTQFAGTEFGGLSSISYDAERDAFYVLSDDQGTIDPVRFYTVGIDLENGFTAGDVEVLDVTTLLDAGGQPFALASLDPEGLTFDRRNDRLIVTSEGIANAVPPIAPFVRTFDLAGQQLGELPVPAAFVPAPGHGVRQNLGFESAAVTPNGQSLLVGAEAALVQDGPAATVTGGSPARIIRYRLSRDAIDRQYVYWTDPIAEPPVPAGSFAVNGLVEMLPLRTNSMLTMERSFSVGAPDTGNTIKLYEASLTGADDVDGLDSIAPVLSSVDTVDKTLLLDLDVLGIPLDNIEGMTFGPDLPDGRRSLVLVSDNNFSAAGFTQFLVFAVGRARGG
jgi:3-phytase